MLPNACPKPPKSDPRPRAHNSSMPIPRERLQSLGPVKATTSVGKSRNARRRAKRFEHDYHSEERRDWMKQQPCVFCRVFGPPPAEMGPQLALRDNCHTGKKPGRGMKSHYTTIVPGCRPHHRMYDDRLAPFDRDDVRAQVEALAAPVHADWLTHQHRINDAAF